MKNRFPFIPAFLMLVLAVILAANVAIWVIPTKSGTATTNQTLR